MRARVEKVDVFGWNKSTTSLLMGGCFRNAPMSSTTGSPGRSRPAALYPQVLRVADLPPPLYHDTSCPGAVPVTQASINIVEVAVGANHGTAICIY